MRRPDATAALRDLTLLLPRPQPLLAPVRAELFGRARLESHARSLAEAQAVVEGSRGGQRPFFPRLADNVAALRQARTVLERQAQGGAALGAAAPWLVDNGALLDEQLHAAQQALPRGLFRRLPVLRDEPLAGLPRVYGMAWAFLAHADSQLDLALLDAFVSAYQTRQKLTLGEFWAFPATLRVLLIENLRRLADRVVATHAARLAAHEWLDGPATWRTEAELERRDRLLRERGAERAFRVQLQQRADDLGGDAGQALAAWLLCQGLVDVDGAEAVLQAEASEDLQSIRHAITSLRGIDRIDWTAWLERHSVVSGTLQQGAVHAAEHPDSRLATLRAVDRLARRSGLPEADVADVLLQLCGRDGDAGDARQAPAWWWRGEGEKVLRQSLGLSRRAVPRQGTQRLRRWATLGYAAAVLGLTAAGTAWMLAEHLAPAASIWAGVVLVLLMVLPASEAVVALLNRLVSESLRPEPLPRLAYDAGLPPEARTLVVIPCMLTQPRGIDALAAQLEQHHLANPEAEAQFALLSDVADADTRVLPGDAALVAHARDAIAALNWRHGPSCGGLPRFLLLHRQRVWSEGEGRYIGWERKRGKLEQLLALLAGSPDADPDLESPFVDLGELSRPAAGVELLLTLDSDTDLPPGALRALASVAMHPLNRPRLTGAGRRIDGGYTLLQPRVATPLPGGESTTWFHRLFSGQPGIDPYSAASSEVYQDLFGEGTFTGKGLMHVQAAHRLLGHRLPEGQVLSHDLLEGNLARCATVSDIVLVEDAPMHADVAASRVHRWTRGDWQLLPFVRSAGRDGVPMIGRWKMVDNLRRSLVAPASLGLLLVCAGWGVLHPVWGLVVVAMAYGAGPLFGAVAGLAPARDDRALRPFYRAALLDLARAAATPLWHLLMLLDQALLQLDAIGRALWRQAVSRRGLLQWTTAEAAQASARTDLPSLVRQHERTVWVAAALAAATGVAVALRAAAHPGWLLTAAAAWTLTPLWVWWASRPLPRPRRERLDEAGRAYFADVSRETWRYFERHVGPDDHHLPPDNVQLHPHLMVAHRTSPTNIGLYLLACCCARELGYIGRHELADRVQATLDTLMRLPRHRGHFLNWYDTRTLAVLPPAYVSTVDSGNLSGHLLVVAQALLMLADERADAPADTRLADALARSQRRLKPLLTVLQATPALQHLALLAAAGPMGDSELASARVEGWLQAARRELAELNLGRVEPDGTGPMWLLHDHVATLESARADVLADRSVLAERLRGLAARARMLALDADYRCLYDSRRRLLHIGWRVDGEQPDDNHYDLLASEARLASLVAIAKGDLPPAHWAALGRPFYADGARAGLKSWSGSMFEYLMPSLVLDEPPGSALDEAVRSAVRLQQALGRAQGRPWGVSESAIAEQDHSLAYQYGPQGAPALALRRVDGDEQLVAPYATALAAPVDPLGALHNLKALEQLGARRSMGFIESLDYTPARQVDGSAFVPVQAFMAHHQAMSLVALAEVLTDGAPRRWARVEPHLRAVAPLLHEPAPRDVPRPVAPPPPAPRAAPVVRAPWTWDSDPLDEVLPATVLLGHGSQASWLHSHGGGHARWRGIGLTRWRDDLLGQGHGMVAYVEGAGDTMHSLTARPLPAAGGRYRARLQPDRAVFDAVAAGLDSRMTVWVSPEHDCELRRIELRHGGTQPLELTLSLAAEVTLAAPAADEAHPAFSNLFVQASWDADDSALYLRRRPRLDHEPATLAVMFVGARDADVLSIAPVTDRARWHGRLGGAAAPGGDQGCTTLAATGEAARALPGVVLDTGLDPVAVLRVRLRLAPGAQAVVTFGCAAARDLQPLAVAVDTYGQLSHVQRSLSLSHTMASVRLRELQIDPASWSALLHLQTLLTAVAAREPAPQRDDGALFDRRCLWPLGLSGERPLLLVTLADERGLPLVQQLKKALRLWSSAGLGVDLVVVNDEPASYLMPVQRQLQQLRERQQAQPDERWPAQQRSTLHVLRAADVDAAQAQALVALARVRLAGDGRTLEQQLARHLAEVHEPARTQRRALPPLPVRQLRGSPPAPAPQGQFDPDDGAYRFLVAPGQRPSRPWVNVLARDGFGFQVSDAAVGCTWAVNSRMHQLTPWSNDALGDPPSEWLLLHDLQRDQVWALGRCDTLQPTEVTHGIGYTRWRLHVADLDVVLTWCVDAGQPLRQLHVQLRGRDDRPRAVRLVAVVDWQLGASRGDRLSVRTRGGAVPSGPGGEGLPPRPGTVVLTATQLDAGAGFGGSTAFCAWQGALPSDSWTTDRRELHDDSGRLVLPRVLSRRDGPGLDPCAALACTLQVDGRRAAQATLLLGHAMSEADARRLAGHALQVDPQDRLAAQRAQWQRFNGAVRVRTPDPAFDAMVNHWLPYQTRVCRLWARAGFYQAGGAFGFRDQLQDAMGLVHHDLPLLAAQIRRHAARQFVEGDVQHWWHEPGGAGVRTRMSDDLLWLPLALALLVQHAGDAALLDEAVPFLQGSEVPPDREDVYETPRTADGPPASLYEHGARAIDRSLRVGAHGLPLMGTGDWNDGMNRVGAEGRGESVWLAWFACTVVDRYLPLAEQRGDGARVAAWRAARAGWARALDDAGWDGTWYRRAYFDDGTPLGSAQNDECRIDLIAQAWAVLSGAGDPDRARQALRSADVELHDDEHALMPLLSPPLQHARPVAGYIQAYPPGVRENGGQYNHAAVWALMAAAQLQQGALAWRLWRDISPAHRWQDPARGERYALEPYVLAGDIYGPGPYPGRGGWSWYTGSAGWLLRAAIESIFGWQGGAAGAPLQPCLPPGWDQATLELRRDGQLQRLVLCATGAALARAQRDWPGASVLTRGALLPRLAEGAGDVTVLVSVAGAEAGPTVSGPPTAGAAAAISP